MTAAEIVEEGLKVDVFFTPSELSERWRGEVTTKTLAQWRSKGYGPKYCKLGGKVLYAAVEIIRWEQSRVQGGQKGLN